MGEAAKEGIQGLTFDIKTRPCAGLKGSLEAHHPIRLEAAIRLFI